MHRLSGRVGLADREAAERLKSALRIAMASKGIDSWEALGLQSKVAINTVHNSIYGRTVPRSKDLRRMGEFLAPYSSAAALEAAYSGIDPPEPLITDVL